MIRWTNWIPDILDHKTDIFGPVFRPPLENWTIQQPDMLGPFKYQTCLVFRYGYCYSFITILLLHRSRSRSKTPPKRTRGSPTYSPVKRSLSRSRSRSRSRGRVWRRTSTSRSNARSPSQNDKSDCHSIASELTHHSFLNILFFFTGLKVLLWGT